MNSERVLYFLGMLYRETSGHSDEIAELYKRALDENDDVTHLKSLLDENAFYREIGNNLYQDGNRLIEEIYTSPSKALEILPKLRLAGETIDQTVSMCSELMLSPMPFSDTITVLRKKNTIAYMSAMRTIASVCVYLMVLYKGMDAIKLLSWNDTVGIQEMLYAVNTKFLPQLCQIERPRYTWVIRRKHLGGKALFEGDFFQLSYENSREVEVLCSALHKERMGTHSFLNIRAYESGEYDVPFCWGVGNLVSVVPNQALSLLQSGATAKLRSPTVLELRRRMPTPIEVVRQLSSREVFCITPDELVLSMNRWQMGYEIEKRTHAHICLFCGKRVSDSQLVCSNHFIRGN